MGSSIFLDSSLLIEYRKGTQTGLFEAIMADTDWKPCISQAVVSEYLFFHLAIFSGKAPLTVKSNQEIRQVLANGSPEAFLTQFAWLPDFENMPGKAVQLMSKYNLLPNDALIIAICQEHRIGHLASFDPDYVSVCTSEGIQLVRTLQDWAVIQAL